MNKNCSTCQYWLPLEEGVLKSSVEKHVLEAEVGAEYLPAHWGKCASQKFKAVTVAHKEYSRPLPLAVFLFRLCVFESGGAAYILATHKGYGCPYYNGK